MRKNVERFLKFYCEQELKLFRESQYYLKMNDLAVQLGYSIESFFDYAKNDKQHIYLSFQVNDEFGDIVFVDQFDYEHFTDASLIVKIDSRERIKLFSWEEDFDFLDSVKWVLLKMKERL